MLPRYNHNIRLCFTDTDSLLYEIQTNDIFSDMDMLESSNDYDFSDYPPTHHCFNAFANAEEVKQMQLTNKKSYW